MSLPASLRASCADGFDWALLAVLSLSLLVHFGGVAWLRSMDWPRRIEPEVEAAAAPPPIVRVVVPQPAVAGPPAPMGPPAPAGHPHRAAVRLSRAEAREAVRKIIGSLGPSGSVEDRLGGNHAAPADLDRILEGASS